MASFRFDFTVMTHVVW